VRRVFTAGEQLVDEGLRIHVVAGTGSREAFVQRLMRRRALLVVEALFVVGRGRGLQVDGLALGQIRRLVEDEAAVLHAGLRGVIVVMGVYSWGCRCAWGRAVQGTGHEARRGRSRRCEATESDDVDAADDGPYTFPGGRGAHSAHARLAPRSLSRGLTRRVGRGR
jgi:hypothetical protein